MIALCSNIITNKSIDLAYSLLKITMSSLARQQVNMHLMMTYSENSTNSSVEMIPNATPVGSVIWLHGLGADGHDFTSLVQQLNLPAHLPLRFIFPHAPLKPVTINNGYVMRAWFDIYSTQMEQRIDVAGIADSVKFVEQLIENEQSKGISSEKIMIGGFSQGSVIAMTTGLQYPKKLAGVIALSGYLPHAAQVLSNKSLANQAIPIFLAHGTEDTVVPFMLGKITEAALEKDGIPVDWHSYPMPHTVCADEIRDINAWLGSVYNLLGRGVMP